MDKLVRFYWIVCDLANGGEAEYTAKSLKEARAIYDGLNVPYKKLVACYYDRDETLCVD